MATDAGKLRADRIDLALAGVALILALAWFSLSLDLGLDLRDEGHILNQSVRTARGELPHRDFVDVYAPGVFAATGLALRLGGGEIVATRWLMAFMKALAVAASFLLARRVVSQPFAVLAALVAIAYWGRPVWNLNAPYASLYTLPLCLVAAWLALRAVEDARPRTALASGVVAGLAVLFKHTLGLLFAGGLGLALLAAGMLADAPGNRPGRDRALSVSVWGAAALALLAPLAALPALSSYALHLLPIHAAMLGIAVVAWRRGAWSEFGLGLRLRVLPFAAGVTAVLSPVLIFYLVAGGLGALLFNCFALPASLLNYALPARLPPLAPALLVAGVVVQVAAALFFLSGRRRQAAAALAVGLAVALVARVLPVPAPGLLTPGVALRSGALLFDDVELAVLLWAAMALAAPGVVAGGRRAAVIAGLILSQAFLCFQIFPRAGFNVWMLQGALAPLLALVLERGYRVGAPAGASRVRRALASVLIAALPVWLCGPVVAHTLESASAPRRAVMLPGAVGLALTPAKIRRRDIHRLEELVAHLSTAAEPDAPLLLLTNQQLILFASGRASALPDLEPYLFWAGWGTLPPELLARLDGAAVLERLDAKPYPLVVERADEYSDRIRDSLPRLAAFVDHHYVEAASFGSYRLLRHSLANSVGRVPRRQPRR